MIKQIIIALLFLLPITVSAQLLRAYGVVEIGSTFPTSSITGAKFAYRTTDSSFYRWVHTNVWIKIVEPSIVPDTLYLQQISGTTAIVNGDTIDLTPYVLKTDTTSILAPYIKLAGWGLLKSTSTLRVDSTLLATKTFTNRFLLKSDTASMLLNYPSTTGYGIIDAGKTWRADTSSPNGLATRLFAKTLPTSILSGQVAYSNGTNLVGSANHFWDNTNGRLGIGTNAPIQEVHLRKGANAAVQYNAENTTSGTAAWVGYRLTTSAGHIGALYKLSAGYTTYKTQQAGDLGFYNGSSGNISILNDFSGGNINFAAGASSTAQMTVTTGGNVLIGTTTDVPTSILTARSTTKSSSPFPLHTLAEADAITGVQGNFDYETTQNGLRWYNGTRKAYARESTQARGTSTFALFSDLNGQSTEHTGFRYDPLTSNFGLGGAPSAQLHMQGNKSAASWTINGIGIRTDAATYTNTTSSGTVAELVAHSILSPTLAASSPTTYTKSSTLRIRSPLSGSNVTQTQQFALDVDAMFGQRIVIEYGNTVFLSSPISTALTKNGTSIWAISRPGSSNPVAVFGQATGTFSTSAYGVVGEALGTSGASGSTFFGVYGSSVGSSGHTTTTNINGVAGSVRLNSGGTGNHNIIAINGLLDLTSSNVGGGAPAIFAASFVANSVVRNNVGATTASAYYSAGLGNPAGSLNTIINYNPLAINSGFLTNVTNHWSYLDHKLSVGATTLATQELDVFGDVYIRDSTRLATTPAHTSISGILTKSASGEWVGLVSVGSGLSYSGGVLSSTWLKPQLEAGSVTINAATNADLFINNLDSVKFGKTLIRSSNNGLLILNPDVGSSGISAFGAGYHTIINGTLNGSDGGTGNIALGGIVTANSSGSNFMLSLGYASNVSGQYAIGLGYNADATTDDAMALGRNSVADELKEISLGSSNYSKLNLNATASGGRIVANDYGIGNKKASSLGRNKPTHLAAFSPAGTEQGTLLDYPLDSIPTNSIYNNLPVGNVTIDADGNSLTLENLNEFYVHTPDELDYISMAEEEIELKSNGTVGFRVGENTMTNQANIGITGGNGGTARVEFEVESRFGYHKVQLDSTDFTISEAKTGSTQDTLFKIDFDGDDSGLLTLGEYTSAAPFTAPALSIDAGEFFTGASSTGKVIQRKMRETTWTNSDLPISDEMLELAQDIFVYANCLFVASDSTVIDLPTPALDYLGQTIEITGDGRNATPNYQVYVRAVGAKLWHQNGGADPSAQTYYTLTSLSSNHNTARFICATVDGTNYYWNLMKQQ